MGIDYLNDKTRNSILQTVKPLTDDYIQKIDMNLRNDNPDGAKIFIKQLQSIIDFVDGI
jgi:hypothetical protein